MRLSIDMTVYNSLSILYFGKTCKQVHKWDDVVRITIVGKEASYIQNWLHLS